MFEKLRHAAGSSVLETHPHYRTAIGVLGVLLPVLLVISLLGNVRRHFRHGHDADADAALDEVRAHVWPRCSTDDVRPVGVHDIDRLGAARGA